MLKSYFLTAFRNIKRQKLYSAIIILGLAVGMTGFALFALTAGVKLTADKFHSNADRIYTVVQVALAENKDEQHSTFLPAPLLSSLQSEFPEIGEAVRILPAQRLILRRGKDSFYENGALFVDPNFLEFFTFDLAAGNPQTALSDPNSMVISEAVALKYFGDDDPVGKVLTLGNAVDVTVTGVLKNIPRTSSLRFNILLSMETSKALFDILDDWDVSRHTGFWRFPKGMKIKNLEGRFPSLIGKYFSDPEKTPQRMYLFPFLDVRLKGGHIASPMASSNMAGVFIIFFLGVLLLFIVSINFINLSTTRYMHRLREIGLRKVIGAHRSQLIKQFLGESTLLAFLALPISIILYELVHPIFAAYVGSGSDVSNSIFHYPFLLKYLLIAVVVTGFFSGIYPAFFVSSFRPVQVLKGSLQQGRKKRRGGKAMIVFQFSISILLIILAGTVKDQFKVLLNADLGFSRDQVAVIQISDEVRSKRQVLQTEIERHPEVLTMSASASIPVVWESPHLVRLADAGKDEAKTMQVYGVDHNFVEALEMKMINGRSFSEELDDKNSLIVSETAAKRLDLDSPVGEHLMIGEQSGVVVGVVRDFLFADIGFGIPPAVLYLEEENLNYMLIKFSSKDGFPVIRDALKEQWLIHAPNLPFDCDTLENHFGKFFDLLSRLAGFLNVIGILGVFFSCLGLLGLASFMVERRTKEIGIRKILGASFFQINWSFGREFILLVTIANVIAAVLVYVGWNRVLQTGLLFFEKISVWTYGFAVFISLFMALAAVTSQVWKSARANPVNSLRQE
ncbi:ABC transporter permease [Acidobacteriota bacterium]